MDKEEKSLRAAEYVLGLLSRSEASEIEARIETDAELRGEVELWQGNLAILFEDVEAEPPRGLGERLEDELFGEPVRDRPSRSHWMPDGLTAAMVVKTIAILSLLLWLLLSL